MAKIEMVGSFVSIMMLLILIVTANGVLGLTGVSDDFGITLNDDLGKELGIDSGADSLANQKTEPNMLSSLTANIAFADSVRSLINSMLNITSALSNLPLVPAWVGDMASTAIVVGGGLTAWFLISGKKV